jgi:hypothetical protein
MWQDVVFQRVACDASHSIAHVCWLKSAIGCGQQQPFDGGGAKHGFAVRVQSVAGHMIMSDYRPSVFAGYTRRCHVLWWTGANFFGAQLRQLSLCLCWLHTQGRNIFQPWWCFQWQF